MWEKSEKHLALALLFGNLLPHTDNGFVGLILGVCTFGHCLSSFYHIIKEIKNESKKQAN